METTRGNAEPVPGELVSVAHALFLPAESYGNDLDIKMAWAMKAMQHAEVYYKLISSVDPQFLKLTTVDDQIYSEFQKTFEKLRMDVSDPEELKSESTKEKWRPFCLKFDGVVEDFNCGTLLRLDCYQGYTEENTIFKEGNHGREKAADSGQAEEKGAKREREKVKTNKGEEKEKEANKEISKSGETAMLGRQGIALWKL
ncbi:unnamed protein product [Nyctereutes procyonoides]|uniref:(raccoon dog) hypothetical protein n=1 Tax=Nyctereutes procyonoides TaxID=34880 RepID=A0A811ZPS3_NYCPR|nr:unnamed protein product [Nyctereutes procyonoides]